MTNQRTSAIPPLAIIGALFFIFGFITWVNGTLIPFLKIACELTYSQALLVTMFFYIPYVITAIPSSFILQKTGYKNGMAFGLVIMAVGALVFIPAAQTRSFGLFLSGLFIQGGGLALLQTASNPYATILGHIDSAAQRISIMGICNKVGGMLSGLILGAIVLKGATELENKLAGTISAVEREALLTQLAGRAIVPYICIAVALLILAFLVQKSGLPEIEAEQEEGQSTSFDSYANVLQFPHLMLGMLAIFCYVGVEVIAADTISQYGRTQGISLEIAGNFTSFTLAFMLVGYTVGIFAIPKYIKQHTALRICALLGVVFSVGIVFTHGYTSVLCVALLGIANSLMWPAIFPLGIKGLGSFTKKGSALLIMGIGGGAVLPYLYGKTSELIGVENSGPQYAYLILIPCYLFILFFAIKGHTYKSKGNAAYSVN